jgi:hypothetical protein
LGRFDIHSTKVFILQDDELALLIFVAFDNILQATSFPSTSATRRELLD